MASSALQLAMASHTVECAAHCTYIWDMQHPYGTVNTMLKKPFQRDHLLVQTYDEENYDAGRPRAHPGAVRNQLCLEAVGVTMSCWRVQDLFG